MSWSSKLTVHFFEIFRKIATIKDRYCVSMKVAQHYDQSQQLVLIKEFKRCIRHCIRTFLMSRKPTALENAPRLRDDYSLTHKLSFVNKISVC